MNANDISKELLVIADNFERGHYDVVVQKSLVLIEKKLREVIKRDLTELESSVQIKVSSYLAAKNKAIDDLTMGEVVGLLRETKFLEAWKRRFNKELWILEAVKLNELVELRNEVAHGTRSEFTREEAIFVRNYQEVVLQSFENEPKLAKELPKKTSKATSKTLLKLKGLFLLIAVVAIPALLASLVALYLPMLILPTPSPSPSPNTAPSQFDCGSVTIIPQGECETLVNFYHSTGGSNWRDNTGWLKTNKPCDWHGVTCEDGKIVRINLILNQLTGSIPDLSQLKELKNLELSLNQLNGSISQVSQLKKLQNLLLFDNQLSGSIPNLSRLNRLEYLDLSRNQLVGLIPDLSQLKQLEYLDLSKNRLTGSVPRLPKLQLESLYSFNISDNAFCRDPNIQYPEKWQKQVNQYPLCSSK